jgi:3-hydroxybutyryl-CoA dehydrogenase
MDENKISIIGSGTMGNGIAHIFSLCGYKVTLIDVNDEILENALGTIKKNMERQVRKEIISKSEMEKSFSEIRVSTELEKTTDSFLVIEAVPEISVLKKELFQKLDNICDKDTILATNTSSISITKLSKDYQPLMKLTKSFTMLQSNLRKSLLKLMIILDLFPIEY